MATLLDTSQGASFTGSDVGLSFSLLLDYDVAYALFLADGTLTNNFPLVSDLFNIGGFAGTWRAYVYVVWQSGIGSGALTAGTATKVVHAEAAFDDAPHDSPTSPTETVTFSSDSLPAFPTTTPITQDLHGETADYGGALGASSYDLASLEIANADGAHLTVHGFVTNAGFPVYNGTDPLGPYDQFGGASTGTGGVPNGHVIGFSYADPPPPPESPGGYLGIRSRKVKAWEPPYRLGRTIYDERPR